MTPLPNTVINFGPELGYATTLKGAQQITSLVMRSYGPYTDKGTGKRKPHKTHYVDFNGKDETGRDTILYRSPVITNAKRLRSLHRRATRKLGEFLHNGRFC